MTTEPHAASAQGARHQDRARRPRPRQPGGGGLPARCRHGGAVHAAVAGDRPGDPAGRGGGRGRDRHLLARHRPSAGAEADEGAEEGAAGAHPVVVGGIVPDDDEKKLKKAGVRHVFHPGASREEIVSRVAELAGEARAAKDEEAAGVTAVCARVECGVGAGGAGALRILLRERSRRCRQRGAVALRRGGDRRPMERHAQAEPRLLRTRQRAPAEAGGSDRGGETWPSVQNRAAPPSPCRCRCRTSTRRAGAGGPRCRPGSAARPIRATAPASR